MFFFCFCKFFYYANLVAADVTVSASTVVCHKIKNISANNEAMLLKLDRHVAPYEIYQMVNILLLLWRQARFQSLSLQIKYNITICNCMGQNTQLKILNRRPNEGGTGIRLR